MSAPRRTVFRQRSVLVVVALLLIAGACVHYPAIEDLGGTRILPERGRVVRRGTGNAADFYVKLNSVGKYGDILLGVSAPVAGRAQVVTARGAPLEALEVPGTAVVALQPNSPHVVLWELTRELQPGESLIVTLFFQKSGGIGVISVVE